MGSEMCIRDSINPQEEKGGKSKNTKRSGCLVVSYFVFVSLPDPPVLPRPVLSLSRPVLFAPPPFQFVFLCASLWFGEVVSALAVDSQYCGTERRGWLEFCGQCQQFASKDGPIFDLTFRA